MQVLESSVITANTSVHPQIGGADCSDNVTVLIPLRPGFAQSSPRDEAQDARSLLLYSVPRLLSVNTEPWPENVLMGERGSGRRSGVRGEPGVPSCVPSGVPGAPTGAGTGAGAGGSTASGTT